MLGDFQPVMEKQAGRLSCFLVGLIIILWWVKNISFGRKLFNIWEDESLMSLDVELKVADL